MFDTNESVEREWMLNESLTLSYQMHHLVLDEALTAQAWRDLEQLIDETLQSTTPIDFAYVNWLLKNIDPSGTTILEEQDMVRLINTMKQKMVKLQIPPRQQPSFLFRMLTNIKKWATNNRKVILVVSLLGLLGGKFVQSSFSAPEVETEKDDPNDIRHELQKVERKKLSPTPKKTELQVYREYQQQLAMNTDLQGQLEEISTQVSALQTDYIPNATDVETIKNLQGLLLALNARLEKIDGDMEKAVHTDAHRHKSDQLKKAIRIESGNLQKLIAQKSIGKVPSASPKATDMAKSMQKSVEVETSNPMEDIVSYLNQHTSENTNLDVFSTDSLEIVSTYVNDLFTQYPPNEALRVLYTAKNAIYHDFPTSDAKNEIMLEFNHLTKELGANSISYTSRELTNIYDTIEQKVASGADTATVAKYIASSVKGLEDRIGYKVPSLGKGILKVFYSWQKDKDNLLGLDQYANGLVKYTVAQPTMDTYPDEPATTDEQSSTDNVPSSGGVSSDPSSGGGPTGSEGEAKSEALAKVVSYIEQRTAPDADWSIPSEAPSIVSTYVNEIFSQYPPNEALRIISTDIDTIKTELPRSSDKGTVIFQMGRVQTYVSDDKLTTIYNIIEQKANSGADRQTITNYISSSVQNLESYMELQVPSLVNGILRVFSAWQQEQTGTSLDAFAKQLTTYPSQNNVVAQDQLDSTSSDVEIVDEVSNVKQEIDELLSSALQRHKTQAKIGLDMLPTSAFIKTLAKVPPDRLLEVYSHCILFSASVEPNEERFSGLVSAFHYVFFKGLWQGNYPASDFLDQHEDNIRVYGKLALDLHRLSSSGLTFSLADFKVAFSNLHTDHLEGFKTSVDLIVKKNPGVSVSTLKNAFFNYIDFIRDVENEKYKAVLNILLEVDTNKSTFDTLRKIHTEHSTLLEAGLAQLLDITDKSADNVTMAELSALYQQASSLETSMLKAKESLNKQDQSIGRDLFVNNSAKPVISTTLLLKLIVENPAPIYLDGVLETGFVASQIFNITDVYTDKDVQYRFIVDTLPDNLLSTLPRKVASINDNPLGGIDYLQVLKSKLEGENTQLSHEVYNLISKAQIKLQNELRATTNFVDNLILDNTSSLELVDNYLADETGVLGASTDSFKKLFLEWLDVRTNYREVIKTNLPTDNWQHVDQVFGTNLSAQTKVPIKKTQSFFDYLMSKVEKKSIYDPLPPANNLKYESLQEARWEYTGNHAITICPVCKKKTSFQEVAKEDSYSLAKIGVALLTGGLSLPLTGIGAKTNHYQCDNCKSVLTYEQVTTEADKRNTISQLVENFSKKKLDVDLEKQVDALLALDVFEIEALLRAKLRETLSESVTKDPVAEKIVKELIKQAEYDNKTRLLLLARTLFTRVPLIGFAISAMGFPTLAGIALVGLTYIQLKAIVAELTQYFLGAGNVHKVLTSYINPDTIPQFDPKNPQYSARQAKYKAARGMGKLYVNKNDFIVMGISKVLSSLSPESVFQTVGKCLNAPTRCLYENYCILLLSPNDHRTVEGFFHSTNYLNTQVSLTSIFFNPEVAEKIEHILQSYSFIEVHNHPSVIPIKTIANTNFGRPLDDKFTNYELPSKADLLISREFKSSFPNTFLGSYVVSVRGCAAYSKKPFECYSALENKTISTNDTNEQHLGVEGQPPVHIGKLIDRNKIVPKKK